MSDISTILSNILDASILHTITYLKNSKTQWACHVRIPHSIMSRGGHVRRISSMDRRVLWRGEGGSGERHDALGRRSAVDRTDAPVRNAKGPRAPRRPISRMPASICLTRALSYFPFLSLVPLRPRHLTVEMSIATSLPMRECCMDRVHNCGDGWNWWRTLLTYSVIQAK